MERSQVGPVLDAWRKLVRSGNLQQIESALEAVYDAEERMTHAESRAQISERALASLQEQIESMTKQRDEFAAHNLTARNGLANALREAQRQHDTEMARLRGEKEEAERLTNIALRAKAQALQESKQIEQTLIGLRGANGQATQRHEELMGQVRALESQKERLDSEIELIRSRVTSLMGFANS